MKKIKISILFIIITILLTGCGGGEETIKISNDTNVNNKIKIIDNNRFKLLNLDYDLDSSAFYNISVFCDTKTNLLYCVSRGNGGGISPFNHTEINHDGDVVIKQYTLDELKKEYKQTQNIDINFK